MRVVMNVVDTALDLVGPGTDVGSGHRVPDGKCGLVVTCGNDSVVLIGTPTELRAQVFAGITLPVPEGVDIGAIYVGVVEVVEERPDEF